MRISERTELFRVLTEYDQNCLTRAADVFRRLDRETRFDFSPDMSFDDAADQIGELVGYATGEIQYDSPIGPQTERDARFSARTIAMVRGCMGPALDLLEKNVAMAQAVSRAYADASDLEPPNPSTRYTDRVMAAQAKQSGE